MATDITQVRPASAQLDVVVPARSRHLGLALVVISMAQLMLVLDELIVNTALPHIQQALNFSGTGLEWVVTGYAVTFGGLLMLGGRAGDILGRRRMFSAGILFFTLASLLGGLATSSWLVVTARVLPGAGGALAPPAPGRWSCMRRCPAWAAASAWSPAGFSPPMPPGGGCSSSTCPSGCCS